MKVSKFNFEVSLSEEKLIIYNTLHNHYILMSKENYDKFKNNTDEFIEQCPSNIGSRLYKEGFCISEDSDETLLAKTEYLRKCYDNSKFCLTIIPTTLCNLRCFYCFVEKEHSMSRKIQTQVLHFVEKLITYRKNELNHFHINWFGGEPTLCPDIINNLSKEIINQCEKEKIVFSSTLFTNLTGKTNDLITMIKANKINKVHTTLDAFGIENDMRRCAINYVGEAKNFYQIINNIEAISKYADVEIQVNLDKTNIESIKKLLNYFVMKCKFSDRVHVGFNLINDNSNIKDKEILLNYSDEIVKNALLEYYSILQGKCSLSLPNKALNCFAVAYNTATIDPNGKLYKCYKESEANKAYGTIFDDEKDYSNVFYEGYKFDPFSRENCKECKILPICYGGCYDSESKSEICSQKFLLEDKLKYYYKQFV